MVSVVNPYLGHIIVYGFALVCGVINFSIITKSGQREVILESQIRYSQSSRIFKGSKLIRFRPNDKTVILIEDTKASWGNSNAFLGAKERNIGRYNINRDKRCNNYKQGSVNDFDKFPRQESANAQTDVVDMENITFRFYELEVLENQIPLLFIFPGETLKRSNLNNTISRLKIKRLLKEKSGHPISR